METTIQSIRFDADQKLKTFITEKTDKLSQFFDGIIAAQVYLKLDKNHERGNKVVEYKLLVPQTTLVASHQAPTFEEGVDACIEQLSRQINKYKEKLRATPSQVPLHAFAETNDPDLA